MARRSYSFAALVIFASLIGSAYHASAATDTWTGGGGDGNWTTAANWNSLPAALDVLQFAGNTNLVTSNNFAAATQFNGINFLAGAGSFTLGGNSVVLGGDINNNSGVAQSITLPLLLDGGTANVNVAAGGSLSLGALTFGKAAQSTNVSTLNVNNTVSATSLVVQTNSTNANSLSIANGQSLNISGAFQFGTQPTSPTAVPTVMNVTGTGTFNATNSSNSNFIVGVGSGVNANATMNVTLDMSGLSNFVYNTGAAGTGQVYVGRGTRSAGTWRLANTSNIITAGAMTVGDTAQTPGFSGTENNAGGAVNLFLGAGTNVLNLGSSQSINYGAASGVPVTTWGLVIGNTKGQGIVQFQSATGSVVIAGQAGGASKTNIIVGRQSSGSGTTALVQMLLAGHDATVQAGTMLVGTNNGSTGASNAMGTFDTGSFNVDNFQLAVHSSGSNNAIGTFYVGASTAVGSTTAVANPGATGVFTVNNTFAIANQTLAGTATGTFGVYGGTANINADILDVSNAGTHTGNVILAGGILNMTNHKIGTSLAPVNFTFTGGNLQNLSNLNDGGQLIKTGGGSATISGTNTYAGSTEINGGTLLVNGSVAGAVNANTGNLGGNGSVGNATIGATASIRPGATAADGAIGTLTMNNLTFSGDYRFDVAAVSNRDLLQVNGIATFSGGTLTPGITSAGTYTILSSPNAIVYNTNPSLLAPTGTRTTYTPHFNANSISVDVVGSALTVFWTGGVNDGSGNFQWDVNATSNWTNGSTADKFFNLDTAVFDDAHNPSGSRNVALNTAVQPVAVVVDSANDYTIAGAGSIGGSSTLTKSGGGKLTLSTTNTYTGSTTVNAGILSITADSNLGAVPAAVTAGQLVLAGGALQATTSFALDPNRGIALGPSTGSGSGTIDVANAADTLTFTGGIANNPGGTGALVKTGAGTLSLGAIQTTGTAPTANTYTGGTSITGGKLQIGSFGALGSGNIAVSNGGTLDLSLPTQANIAGGFGTRVVTISGSGVGGLGALYSAATVQQQNAFSKITLAGDATIGGVGAIGGANAGRFDIRNNSPTLDLAGFTLTKTGTNIFSLVSASVTSGDIVVTPATGSTTGRNILSVEGTTSIPAALKPDNVMPYTITYNDFTNLQTFGLTSTTLTRQIVMNGDVLLTNNSTNLSTLVAPVRLNAGSVLTMNTSQNGLVNGNITLTGLIDGAGRIVKENTAATLTISGTNTYSGGTTVNNGTVAAGSDAALGTGAVGVGVSGTLDVNARNLGVSALNDVLGSGGIVTNNAATAGTLNITGGGGSFAGALQNGTAPASVLNLTKSGTGTQTLSGSTTFTGTTTVTGGTLVLAGTANLANSSLITVSGGTLDVSAFGSSYAPASGQTLTNNAIVTGGVSVALGATVRGTGNFTGGGLSLNGGTIAPGNAGVGNLSMSGLTVTSGKFLLDFAATNSSDGLIVNGSATFNGDSSILPTAITPPSGLYTVLTATSLSGTAPTAPTTTRSTYVVHFGNATSGANKIAVQVTAVAPKTIFWKGNAAGDNTAWDALGAAGHANWTDGAIAEKYFDFDTVVFDDAHAPVNRNVQLNTTVTPTAVTVDNSAAAYTIGGSGGISGATGLTKRGTNVLNLSTNNTYTGPTNVENGTLSLGSFSALPSGAALTLGTGATSGTVELNGNSITVSALTTSGTGLTNTLNNSNSSSPLTITYAGGTSVFDGIIKEAVGAGSISLTLNSGSLTLGGNSTMTGNISTASGSTLVIGNGGATGALGTPTSITNNGVLAFNRTGTSTIGDFNGAGSIQQLGAGTTILAGAGQTYTTTTINAGTLQIGNGGTSGSLGSGAIATQAGGTLAINRSDAVALSNVISGGGGLTVNSPATGVVTVSGANTYTGSTLVSGGTLRMSGTTFGTLGSNGTITVSTGGTLDLGGITANNVGGGFGARQVFISGPGAVAPVPGVSEGVGALANTSTTVGQQNAFQNVTLTDDATVGNVGTPAGTNNPGRFDVRGGVALLNLNGHTLTKIGTNQFTLVGATVNGGNIVVETSATGARNMLSLETTTSILAGTDPMTSQAYTVTYKDNTNLQMFNLTSANVTRQFVLNGDVLVSNNSTQLSTLTAPINITSGSKLRAGATLANTNNPITLSGVISGPGEIIKEGTAVLTLSGNNSYTGSTTVNSGTLTLGAANRITDTSNMVLGGGTFNTAGFDEKVATLNVAATSTIDLGATGASLLRFDNSSALSWGGTLAINNWSNGLDRVFVGGDASGLTAGQLSQINFTVNGNPVAASILSTGELYPTGSLPTFTKGDWDRNGVTNPADIQVMLRALTDMDKYRADFNVLTDAELLAIGDFNAPNTAITNRDIQGLLNHLAGLNLGSLASVPEPTGFVLGAMALAGVVFTARRRKNHKN